MSAGQVRPAIRTDAQEHEMYGPGTAPPQPRPTRWTVIVLRVLFTALPVVTIGVCAFGSVLRLDVAQRRPVDWMLTPIVGALGMAGFVMVGVTDGGNSWPSNTGMTFLLVCALVTPTYFLIMDIRAPQNPQARPAGPVAAHPYPYAPGPVQGPAPGAVHGHITSAPGVAGPGGAFPGYGQQRPAAPTPPAGPRISQVRAELDELSDFLRKEEGR
jgi:hypothetical protein